MIYNIIVKDSDGEVTDIVSFSSVTSFNESYQSEVTENTVEFGFKISDHMITKSPEITVEGVISDYSIYDSGAELYWDEDRFVCSNGLDGSTNLGGYLTAKQALIDIVQKMKLFTIISTEFFVDTSNKKEASDNLNSVFVSKYSNCVMPSLSFPIKNGVSGATFVNFTAKQIRVAKTKVEDIDTKTVKFVEPKKAVSNNPTNPKDANGKSMGDSKGGNKTEKIQKYSPELCEDLNRTKEYIDDLANTAKSNSEDVGYAKTYTTQWLGKRAEYGCDKLDLITGTKKK